MKFFQIADIHLRADNPRCRKNTNWMDVQRRALQKVATEAIAHKCPIAIVGDIFNTPVVSEEVLNLFLEFAGWLSDDLFFIAGNHDLPNHSMEMANKSSIGVLFKVAELNNSKIKPIRNYMNEVSWQNFGNEIENPGKDILFIHRLIFKSPRDMPPNANGTTAQELLDEFPEYKYICVGDCHKPFCYKSKDNRYVINSGHLTIQKIDEIEQPIGYYVDTDNEYVEEIEIGDDAELVSDEYAKKEEEREDNIEAFMELLQSHEDVTLSFVDNIETALEKNKDSLDISTVNMVRFLMEDENDK